MANEKHFKYRVVWDNEPNIVSSLPNKSDIEQAADQTTVLLFTPKILVNVSLIIREVII